MQPVQEEESLESQAKSLAKQIDAWREVNNLTKAALLRRFSSLLGSDRTYAKMMAGQLADLDAGMWVDKYSEALERITRDADSAGDEILWSDLTGVRQVRAVALAMLRTTENDRCALLMGENGMGKTSAFTLLKRQHEEKMVIVQAVDGLTASAFAFAGQLLLALEGGGNSLDAVRRLPSNFAARLGSLQDKLRSRRLIIAIEEGQDLGEGAFKLIKTLINTTRAGFIIAAIPTLWRNLARANFEDVAQLTGNRNGGSITLKLNEADVEKALTRLCPKRDLTPKETRHVISQLLTKSLKQGYFKFVVKALRRAQALADNGAVTADHLAAGIDAELEDRGITPSLK